MPEPRPQVVALPAPDTLLAAAVLAGPAQLGPDGAYDLRPFLTVLGQLEAVLSA